jgi:hypothetical protein
MIDYSASQITSDKTQLKNASITSKASKDSPQVNDQFAESVCSLKLIALFKHSLLNYAH